MRKLTFEEVKEFIEGKEGNGCKLISTKYVNNSTKLKIQCACGEIFETTFQEFKKGNKRQCNKCGVRRRSEARMNRVTFNCEWCDKEKTIKESMYKRSEHHFCSKKCHDEWQTVFFTGENNPNFGNGAKISGENNYWYGKQLPEETRKKISESRKGKYTGEDNPNFGKFKERFVIQCSYCRADLEPMTENNIKRNEKHFCKDKDCYAKWISENKIGKNHPNYNPNLTEEDRMGRLYIEGYSDFIKNTYKRDNYTCQCCGQRGGKLNAHHINGYNWDKENRTNVNNGIVLCEDCHNEFHSIYSKGDNTWKQFREFLYNKYLQTNNLHFLALIETIDLRFIQLNNKAS